MNLSESDALWVERYQQGWEVGFECVGDDGQGEVVEPAGADDGYLCGFWNGVGEARAWFEGVCAAELGILFCPYPQDPVEGCFRDAWLDGYKAYLEARSSYETQSGGGWLI